MAGWAAANGRSSGPRRGKGKDQVFRDPPKIVSVKRILLDSISLFPGSAVLYILT